MMEWHNLRLNKGQNIQNFMEEFRKRDLELKIRLDYLETLMKYVGALPNYFHHTLLLLNPTNLDEASVQETHIESMGKHVQEVHQNKNHKFKNNKFKG